MSTSIELNAAPRKYATFTRAYKGKTSTGRSTVKTGSITIAVADISSVVASNSLGRPEHRSTITLISGKEFNLKDTYQTVAKLMRG